MGIRIAFGLSFKMGVWMDGKITLFMEGRYAIRLGAIRDSTLCGGDAREAISQTLLVLVLGVLKETMKKECPLAIKPSGIDR